MDSPVTIAAVQLCSTDDLPANLATCRRLGEEAGAAGAKVIVLPECFAFLGRKEGDKMVHAENIDAPSPGPIMETLLALTEKTGAVVVGGGMPETVPGDTRRAYNTAVVVAPGKGVIGRYRKVHLFDVDIPGGATLRESDGTCPGDSALVVAAHGLRMGLSICYDVRFPEHYRRLWRDGGANVLLVPAAFTAHTGAAHWHLLLRARAVEDQCYVVAAAQWGQHNEKRKSFGHSLVVDPWGSVVSERPEGDGVVLHTLDPELLAKTRRNMPCGEHAVTLTAPSPVSVVSV
jgi:predicted amidohydrolase